MSTSPYTVSIPEPLITIGSRPKACSIGMLSDAMMRSPRPLRTAVGRNRTAAHNAAFGTRSMTARPHTPGADRITPSASAAGTPAGEGSTPWIAPVTANVATAPPMLSPRM